MGRSYCNVAGCGVSVINPIATVMIAYGTAALVLAKPIFNSLGADVKNISSIINVNSISITSLILFATVIFSGYLCSHDRHTHPLFCLMNACGIPGAITALMAAVS